MLISAELQVILFLIVILAVGYLSIMPFVAKDNIKRLFVVDLALLTFSLAGVGVKFSGLDISFSLLLFNTNWFIFTLVCFSILESPLAIWYMRKHGIDLNNK